MIAQQQKKSSKKDRHRVMAGCHSLGATVSSAISRSSLPTCWRNSLAIPGRRSGACAERAHIANPRLQQLAFHARFHANRFRRQGQQSVIYRGDHGISQKQAVVTEPFYYGRSDKWMMV